MTDIKIRKAEGTWTVRAGGAVLAESRDALELSENGYPEIIYFPRGDVAMAFLDQTDHTSHCPKKGDATYYSIVNKSSVTENMVWSYEAPKEELAEIKGYLAFHTSDSVKVEQI